jgi:hypothetical protein
VTTSPHEVVTDCDEVLGSVFDDRTDVLGASDSILEGSSVRQPLDEPAALCRPRKSQAVVHLGADVFELGQVGDPPGLDLSQTDERRRSATGRVARAMAESVLE